MEISWNAINKWQSRIAIDLLQSLVLSLTGADNDNASCSNVNFYYQRHKIICPYTHIICKKKLKKYKKFLAKNLKDQCTGKNINQKLWVKIQEMS